MKKCKHVLDQDRPMDKDQFKKKKKRKVRMNKTIRAIESYLMNFVPKIKGKVYHNLNRILNIPDSEGLLDHRKNPLCLYSPYTMKRSKLFRKGK